MNDLNLIGKKVDINTFDDLKNYIENYFSKSDDNETTNKSI